MQSPEFLALQQALAGHYSLTRELGRGGMGVVYLAQEVRLDRPVALKVLPREFAADAVLRERFLHEARTAARLSHPHIVPIHAVHEIGDVVFFAMSYIEGGTLGERIRAQGPLPPKAAARILREVGWALAYAHAQGVIHRDVKPDNILLEAGSGRAVVTDFGIAHVDSDRGLPDAGVVFGTAEFMSPEQAVGAPVDERSDLYALGVVAYYMLSGRLPFQGATATETLAMHLTQSPPALASIAPGLPAPLAHAVDRCLARDPMQRFATGEELAGALAQAVETRRDVPIALRLFIKQNRDSTASIVATEIFSVGSVTVWGALFAAGVMEFELVPLLAPSSVWVVVGATPVVMLVQMVRRLLRSGYEHDDLVRAMRDDLDDRRGDLAAAYGSEPSRLDRWLKRLLTGGLGAHLGGIGWMAFGPWLPGVGGAVVAVTAVSCATWVVAGSAAAARHHLRGNVPGRGWLKFWESRVGRALFRASGFRLETPTPGAPYGPTELAIGIAADRLFRALPTAQRDSFRELPDVVHRLEADAERMRAHLKELDALIDEVGEAPALAAELTTTRAAAGDRLRVIVVALDTIRVELLRLHAGAASTASVTMDLNAAKSLSSDVARMLDGMRDVERLLGRRAAPELGTMPTPA
jgi:serine/threonine-protein kinase